MDAVDLRTLSAAELTDLVRQLQAAHEQLLTSAAALSQLSVTVQQALAPGAASDQVRALLAMSQFLTVEHSDEELAAMLGRQSAELFEVDGGVLFLADEAGGLAPASPTGLPASAEAVDYVAATARQAWQTQSVVTAPGNGAGLPACAALPLVRHGRGIGAFVLTRAQPGELGFAPETWALATIFAGVVAVACANLQHVAALRREARLLEALVEQRTRQLQSSRDVLRAVFDHLPEGVLLLDADDRVLAANTVFCETILGRHPRDVVGQQYGEVLRALEKRAGAQGSLRVTAVAAPGDGRSGQRLVFWGPEARG
ncbi:MAG TPA: GAF domain-containing protein [Roseiflexaceae bacterium]|nr:GAF domain-containing protein [Roseiflexaceae bacterium]